MTLLIVSLAPVFLIAFYIYFRDKYEKEPIGILLRALLAGAIIVIPILIIEGFLQSFSAMFKGFFKAGWDAFAVAAFTEESFKYLALYLIIWNNKNFNEKFDGIVYAAFIALGFAGIENVFYVFRYGHAVAIMRALTAVPAHALFGVTMGYYFGLAKFEEKHKKLRLRLAWFVPIILHGIYDFILFVDIPAYLLIFLPYIVYIWVAGLKKMKKLSDASVFKPRVKE
ncbi:MAG: PrsW family intramembrane metalloprotease [Bacteroidales bacterium]|nr:PrsW family intramembrane metalloprotease [Bacteroidales bacterium]